ncbi:MAG: hypothetical protein KIH08_05045 [Candidatus Freyarchaeota archaeon]|nr:hypothetical protein [Candidatus Jordarchaeia archaeon]MBS7268607.1 hypothetical protein [Candidatus Jordarchaeia archaeon]MBS7279296.1 hypothetical protein [Candidatus Jordarchaeia archaeon]
MLETYRYGMMSGIVAGIVAAVMGLLLFTTFHSFNSTIFATILSAIGTLIATLFLGLLVVIIVIVLIAIFGGNPAEAIRKFFEELLAPISAVIMLGYLQGLGYSLSVSSFNPIFTIFMAISGILIAVGFFLKFRQERRSSYLLRGFFAIMGITVAGILIYLGLSPVANYALGALSLALLFTAYPNYLYLNIAAVLLLLAFMGLGIMQLRDRQESAKPTLCTGVGIMEVLSGILFLGGTVSYIMFIPGFASMLITLVLWIPYTWSENGAAPSLPKKASRKGPQEGVQKWE